MLVMIKLRYKPLKQKGLKSFGHTRSHRFDVLKKEFTKLVLAWFRQNWKGQQWRRYDWLPPFTFLWHKRLLYRFLNRLPLRKKQIERLLGLSNRRTTADALR